MIKIVDGIFLKQGKVKTRDAKNNLVSLHRRQGDIDGACAVYCTMMSMLHIGYLEKSDLEVYNIPDKRTPKGKILHELLWNNGLVINGFGYIELKRIIENLCGSEIEIERYYPRKQEAIVQKIVDLIDDNIAPIISVKWKWGVGHALLAIGYERDDEDSINNILCLDPGFEAPKVCTWNCYMDVSKAYIRNEFPIFHYSMSGEKASAKLADLLVLRKRTE